MGKALEDAVWKTLSREFAWNKALMEKFEEHWNWSKLSENQYIEFTFKLVDRFAYNWDWKKLINIWRVDNLFNEEFLIKFSKYIPGAELQSSRLWSDIVGLKAEELKSDILANI